MKGFCQLLLLCICFSSQAKSAPELWHLEVSESQASYLLEKTWDNDSDLLEKAYSRLPVLIKEGKVIEIERIRINQKGNILHDFSTTNEAIPVSTGIYSQYDGLQIFKKFDYWRQFYISRPLPQKSLTFYLGGQLGPQWFPSFSYHEDGKQRLILERDTDSIPLEKHSLSRLSISVSKPWEATYIWLTQTSLSELEDHWPTEDEASFLFINQSRQPDPSSPNVKRSAGTHIVFGKSEGDGWQSLPSLSSTQENAPQTLIFKDYYVKHYLPQKFTNGIKKGTFTLNSLHFDTARNEIVKSQMKENEGTWTAKITQKK